MTFSRRGRKWTITECLQLQREYELLGWSIDQISEKHERTPLAIIYKLSEEGFADFNKIYDDYFIAKEQNSKKMKFVESDSSDESDGDESSDYEEELEPITLSTVSQVEVLQEQIRSLQQQLNNITHNTKQSKSIFSSLF